VHSCRTKEIFITHINMNGDIKKRELIAEKASINVEYRKIMNESEGARKVDGEKLLSKLVV